MRSRAAPRAVEPRARRPRRLERPEARAGARQGKEGARGDSSAALGRDRHRPRGTRRSCSSMARAENDDATLVGVAADVDKLEKRRRGARVPAHVLQPAGPEQLLRRHPGRRRRHRGAGLGRRCCCACTCAGATASGFEAELLEVSAGEVAGIKSATLQVERRLRLRLAAHRDRRAPPGAQVAVRFRQPPPHLVRLACSSRPKSTTTSRSRSTRPTCAIDVYRSSRRRRPARQQDRVGGAHHAHARPASWCSARTSAPAPQPRRPR